MRVVIQRVLEASVTINHQVHSCINEGLFILLGIEENDTLEDINWLCAKIVQLRIFNDAHGVMNISVLDKKGELLVVSQFTLHASTKKGNRPSYLKAARPEKAIPLYENFISCLGQSVEKPIKTGVFGADMQINLINDGPVTIIMDSKNKE